MRAMVVLVTLALAAGGCRMDQLTAMNPLAGGNTLALRPVRGEAQSVTYTAAYYSYDQRNHLTIVLLEGPEDRPRSAVTIRLYWRPQVGSTPMARSATNTSITRMLLEQDGAPTAAVYAGAGFLNPATSKGQDTFRGELVDANLRLVDAVEGFTDTLGAGTLTGRITATRDDARTQKILRQLQQRVSERLGYPRLVMR